MLVTTIFSFSQNIFQPIQDKFHHLEQFHFIVCKFFVIGPGQDFVVWLRINPLPNDKFLDWCKLKAFADDKINVT